MVTNIQESSNLNATITSKVDGVDTPILTVSANLNGSLTSFMFNVNMINLDACKTNSTDVQSQLNDFIANQLKTKMTTMGYPIVLT